MTPIRRIAAIVLVCLALPALAREDDNARSLSPAEWDADLTYMAHTIKAVHPRPFHAVGEAELDLAVVDARAKLGERSDLENLAALRRIVALVGDGHTWLSSRSERVGGKGVIPLRIERFADGIFVTAAPSDRAELVGARVHRIGVMDAERAWNTLRADATGDNQWSRDSVIPIDLTNADLLHGIGISETRDALTLRVAGRDGSETDVTVAAEEIPGGGAWYYRGRLGPGESSIGLPAGDEAKWDLPHRNPGMAYWYAMSADGLLYARINQINDSRDPAFLDGEGKVVTLGEFAAEVMKRIDAGNVKKLVLDVRANGGGNNRLARGIVHEIAKRDSINRRGRLFVITGRITYSAAMNFVSMLEDRTEALFVGEPAGGSPHHDGDAMTFTLPNSKLQLRVSTLHWDLGVEPTDVRQWIEPDIPAPPNFADLANGVDRALDRIRSWTPESQLEDRMLAKYEKDGLAAALDEGRKALDAGGEGSAGAQALLRFADGVIAKRKSREDVFRAFAFASEMFPDSVEAWFARGRVAGFVGEHAEAEKALARARALSPNNDTVVRMHEAYRRLVAPAE